MRPGVVRPVAVGAGAGVGPKLRASLEHVDYDRPVPLRRGTAVRRSRRGRVRRWLKPLAVMLALVSATTAAVTWLMVSPRFAVRELAVASGERVPAAWVREALAPMVGENLPRLELARAEEILRRHPWVRGADLRKDLPARLAVRVEERRAVALLRAADGLYYLDARGERIASCDPAVERGVDLPLISTAADSASAGGRLSGSGEAAGLRAAIRLLSELDEVEPSWIRGLSEVEILGTEDFRLHTSRLPFPVLVSAGTLSHKARRLEELLPRIVERYGATAVDLRFARRIIVKPSVPGTEQVKATIDHAQRG